ncbi:MAG: hypothetical protein FWE42_09050, partial [Defluviitaleaceae bacterium]|nr:hypothetical protein [Defluviitaleaceae bacterium]
MDINMGYIWNQLGKAFDAKIESKDTVEEANASKRLRQWSDILSGIVSGRLNFGTRKPTKYPVWVTPEVARGGFATGKAMAATDFNLSDDEQKAITLIGLPRTREALFVALISEEGRLWLQEILASRMYKIQCPEDAVLLVIAWLYENNRADEAAAILNEISTHGSELRFMPKLTAEPLKKTDLVHRYSANDIKNRLQKHKPNKKVETQREALQIWIPFVDKLFFHWLELLGDGCESPAPSQDWKNKAKELLQEYETLKKSHTLCKKYHNKKENLQIVIEATRCILYESRKSSSTTHREKRLKAADFSLGCRRDFQRFVLANKSHHRSITRARYAVDCYVKAHGKPTDSRLIEMRKEQQEKAALPAHSTIAKALAEKLPISDYGLADTESFLGGITIEGYGETNIPINICKIVRSAVAASMPELIKKGIVTSAEIVAEITPQLTAQEVGRAFASEDISMLMAETYNAFARRRSLLLLDLASQVRFDELPWVMPLLGNRQGGNFYVKTALRLAAYVINYFPGVILPNPLVAQLNMLYYLAGKGRPFMSELAADIFMGRFVKSFDDAAFAAAALLKGSVYERYYDLDYLGFANAYTEKYEAGTKQEKALLDSVVKEYMNKKPSKSTRYVVRNGMQIEYGQIYTTHNLATLIAENVKLEKSYEELATESFCYSMDLIIKSVKANIAIPPENRPKASRIFGASQGSADDAGQEGPLEGADA